MLVLNRTSTEQAGKVMPELQTCGWGREQLPAPLLVHSWLYAEGGEFGAQAAQKLETGLGYLLSQANKMPFMDHWKDNLTIPAKLSTALREDMGLQDELCAESYLGQLCLKKGLCGVNSSIGNSLNDGCVAEA